METLTYIEAHELVDAAAQMGALGYLAAHWEMAGHWNEHATWTAEQLRQHVDDMTAQTLEAGWDSRDGSNPPQADDDSDTGLAPWDGVL